MFSVNERIVGVVVAVGVDGVVAPAATRKKTGRRCLSAEDECHGAA